MEQIRVDGKVECRENLGVITLKFGHKTAFQCWFLMPKMKSKLYGFLNQTYLNLKLLLSMSIDLQPLFFSKTILYVVVKDIN